MKRRLLCIISALLLILSFPAAAEGEIDIMYPQNGAIVAPDDNAVRFMVSIPSDYAVLYLDGEEEKKFEGASEVEYIFEEGFSIGEHTLKVVAVSGKDVYVKESSFTAALSESSTVCDDDMQNAPTVSGFGAINQSLGGEDTTKAVKVAGRGGAEDGAFGFQIPIERPANASRVQPYLIKQSINWTEEMTIEMDLYFSGYANLGFETKSAGGWGNFFGSDYLFVYNSSGCSITGAQGNDLFPANEWFRVKMVIDFTALKGDMYIGRYNNEGEVNYTAVFENFAQGKNLTGTIQMKIQPTFYGTYEGQYLGVDNLLITETKYTKGLSALMYEKDGEYTMAEGNEVPCGTSKIRLSTSGKYSAADIKEEVEAFEEGYGKKIESATINGSNLDITFKNPLTKGAEIDINLSGKVLLANKDAALYKTKYSFKVSKDKFSIDNVKVTSDDEEILCPYQLSGKSEALVEAAFSKGAYEGENAMLIVISYKDGRAEGLFVKNITEEDGSSVKIPLTMSGEGNMTLEVFIAESFAASAPLSNIWSIK